MKSDLHDIRVIYQTETERAVCIREHEGGADIWIPKSLCEVTGMTDELRRGDIVTLTAPESVLTEKRLV